MDISTDRKLIRSRSHCRRYLRVNLLAPQFEGTRVALNLALVIDRSGSMEGNKIELVRQAAKRCLKMLSPQDRVAVVAYDDKVDVLFPSALATPQSLQRAGECLDSLDARGWTDLSGGWFAGAMEISRHRDGKSRGRCLLLTDGEANRGTTEPKELERHARRLREQGVATSTFGVGQDFNEVLLQRMAEEGWGNFRYIENEVQIIDYLTSELRESLEVSIPEARLEVARGVVGGEIQVKLIHAFTTEHTPDGLVCYLGNLVSRQQVELIFAVDFPAGDPESEMSVEIKLRGGDGVLHDRASMTWRYADHAANDHQPRLLEVGRGVAEAYAARARLEALEHNRRGNFGAATQVLERTVEKIERFADNDPEILRCVADLRQEQREVYHQRMSAREIKSRHYGEYSKSRSRASSGDALRD